MLLQDIQMLARIAVSIVLEAAPFLLLGSLLSAAIERYVDTERIGRRIPKGPLGRMAVGLLGGMLMPICECGSVPLARRLLGKGVPPLTAVTYMLAAPVINPVVLLSTYVAFGGNMKMVLSRAAVVAVSAALTGWLCAGRMSSNGQSDSIQPMAGADLTHPHPHAGQPIAAGGRSRWAVVDLLSSGAAEFLDMGKYLVLGALTSAAFKVFLPWQLVQALGGNAAMAVTVLMLLAVLLCVCSEADAFVAASFVYAPPSAQLAFMAVGAMVDLKLVGMYFSAFPKKIAWMLIVVPVVCVFGLSNLMFLLVG
jgi:uncharacterized membrane protein YraQ (UPF0718 family)